MFKFATAGQTQSYCAANPTEASIVVKNKGRQNHPYGMVACLADGMRLPVIRSQEELEAIRNISPSGDIDYLFV